ncbi:RNA polymerase subunit sigma [Planctomycetales bacterium 10988]|nr:RNA polymerase subunit sigma [Planctomycetales bacterium 10988]
MNLDQAFKRLVIEHHVPLRAFVRTLGVDPEWVDDLAQEVFLVALREQESFDRQQDLGKWLRGIARNLVRNEIRKQARRQRILHEGLAELLVETSAEEPEAALWKTSQLTALRDCVEQLPAKSRQLVTNRYCDGWKAPDLADNLGMSAVAVRKALMRIRRQLKACIEQKVAESF